MPDELEMEYGEMVERQTAAVKQSEHVGEVQVTAAAPSRAPPPPPPGYAASVPRLPPPPEEDAGAAEPEAPDLLLDADAPPPGYAEAVSPRADAEADFEADFAAEFGDEAAECADPTVRVEVEEEAGSTD